MSMNQSAHLLDKSQYDNAIFFSFLILWFEIKWEWITNSWPESLPPHSLNVHFCISQWLIKHRHLQCHTLCYNKKMAVNPWKIIKITSQSCVTFLQQNMSRKPLLTCFVCIEPNEYAVEILWRSPFSNWITSAILGEQIIFCCRSLQKQELRYQPSL